MKRARKALDVLRELVENSIFWQYVHDRRGQPGEAIERLSKEDREALKQLKPEDTANTRWPNPEFMFDKSKEDEKKRQEQIWRKNIDKV